jgi:Ras-related protein Rab-23
MLKRFCTGDFTDKYKKTIGVDFLEKEHTVPGLDEPVRLQENACPVLRSRSR